MEIYRQGDIILCPMEQDTCLGCGAELSHGFDKAIATPQAILALGETTGHMHKLQGNLMFGPPVVRVLKIPATLTHEDHGEPRNAATGEPVKVSPGDYHIHQQQVMDYRVPKPTPRPSYD